MGYNFEEQKQIDAILITHKYDTTCVYLTLPEIYENSENTNENITLLDEIAKVLT